MLGEELESCKDLLQECSSNKFKDNILHQTKIFLQPLQVQKWDIRLLDSLMIIQTAQTFMEYLLHNRLICKVRPEISVSTEPSLNTNLKRLPLLCKGLLQTNSSNKLISLKSINDLRLLK